jgi:hypothetical protein
MVLASILMMPFYHRAPSAIEIEERARSMGMVYEDEVRALSNSKDSNTGEGEDYK